jgi:hypothetical protein
VGSPLPPSRATPSRAQLVTQHRACDRRFTHDGGQTGKYLLLRKPSKSPAAATSASNAASTTSKCPGPVVYDGYGLLPAETADALGHTTTARYDYCLMQARLVTDPNLNRTAYGFSALGLHYQPSTWLDYDFFAFTQREKHYQVSPANDRHAGQG